MAKIQIPKQFLPGFEELFNLSEIDFQKLIKELNSLTLGIGPRTFVETLVSKFNNSQIITISKTIFSLGNLLDSQELSIEELASELTNSYFENLKPEINKNEKKHFEDRVIEILKNLGSLKLTFKAINLLTENDKNFIESHIITDVRFIFQEEIENINRQAVIIHRLKLDYRKDNQNKEFFLALDNNDLIKLKKQIDRALDKEELIKKDYHNSVSFIDITD